MAKIFRNISIDTEHKHTKESHDAEMKYWNLPPSLHFNGHFPGEPVLAVVYWSKGWWKWWWQLEL